MFSRLAEVTSSAEIVTINLEPGGRLGRHSAAAPQLFIVTGGQGEVSGDDEKFVEVRTGQAVLWKAGESHETRTQVGLTAIIVEGDGLQLGGL